jgi:hypothetical protein
MLMGSGRQKEPGDGGQQEGTSAYRTWLKSSPMPGEAFGDTGLASAEACRKLRWSPGKDEEDLLGTLMQSAVTRNQTLFQSGRLEAEAARVSSLAADALTKAGLDPRRFGISAPQPPGKPASGPS